MSRLLWRICLFGLLLAASLALPARAQTSAPKGFPASPGTLISSQAFLNYVDQIKFLPRSTPSNTVRVLVTGAPRLVLTQNQTLTRSAGSFFTFVHILENPGNVLGTYTVTPALAPGSPVDLLNLGLVLDLNANGVIDVGEPRLPFGPTTVEIAAGARAFFILTGQIEPVLPAGLPANTELTLTLRADLAETSATALNIDTLRIATETGTDIGSLEFIKSVTPSSAVRGGLATYTLTGTNNYTTPLQPINITVDGANQTKVVIRDNLPANLGFVEIVTSNNVLPLYHLAGALEHHYTTSPPSDLSLVDAVAWAFPPLAAGQSFSVSYRVRVGQNATGLIPNIAYAHYTRGGDPIVTASNPAYLTVPTEPPVIRYYNNENFELVIQSTGVGANLFLQADSGACNASASTIEEVTIIITNPRNGDVVSFSNVAETGPNTGAFRITPYVRTQGARDAVNDQILQVLSGDELIAEIVGCGGVTVRTRILIDPAGVVYDSRSNLPVAGAVVSLVNVATGELATVFQDDTVTPSPNPVTTLADGMFRFPLVAPGNYQLRVVPPDAYTFPSVIPAGLQPAGRRYINLASTGGAFPVNFETGPVFLDLPLDLDNGTAPTGEFVLEKLVNGKEEATAEIGDSVIYTLTLTNASLAAFNGTRIDDHLPDGFRYIPGTTRRDDVAIADPSGGVGPTLRFPVGTLAVGESVTFTYRARIGPGAEKGDGINRARATSLGPPILLSNVARARVNIELGVFDPSAVILGRVFVDADRDGLQRAEEPGIPGVRLVLEDGTYAITDEQGRYSIYGQRPVTHVLKLDPSTLPPGAVLGGEGPRFAGHPGLRFVDLKKYELHKANFTVIEPTPELLAAIEARRRQAIPSETELTTALSTQFTPDGTRTIPTDLEARPASGLIVSTVAAPSAFDEVLPLGTLNSRNSSLPSSPTSPSPIIELEQITPTLQDDTLDFLGLKDGDTLPRDLLTVRIKGPLEARLQLLVNGTPAPDSRIGKAVEQNSPSLQAVEYVALRLTPGPNTLEIVTFDLFGNERARRAITVIAPDSLARLKLEFSDHEPKADGRTPVQVTIRATDAKGVPVTANLPLTLETTLGRWDAPDANPDEPGIQVSLTDGSGVFRLIPPIEPGQTRLVVSSGTLKAEQNLSFLPELRPMIASGIIEGRFSLNRLSLDQILPTSPSDAFEEELHENLGSHNDATGKGRAAFYLKGKVKGDVLLTIAYDSDKRAGDTKLFRDLDPDAYYPVYGDSSIRGYDAQSTGKLYVRLDKNRSFALLGDYSTRAANPEVRQLGDYNRSLNGVRVQHETNRFRGGLWASDDSTSQIIDEIRANGTSGPFTPSNAFGLINSETVEIIVRDRNQTSVILSATRLRRNADYDFEPFTGRILLRRPLASVDSNFNPQFLRITYEVENGGEPFWIYGGDVAFKPAKRLEVGGSFARDENPLNPYDLQSVNSTLRISDGTYLITEAARSQDFVEGPGHAARAELRHKSEKTDARVFLGRTEPSFVNPASTLASGRTEGGAKITRDLNLSTQLITEAVYSSIDPATLADATGANGHREGIRTDVAHTFDNLVKVTVGARVSEETITPAGPVGTPTSNPSTPTPLSVRSLRLRIDTPVPRAPRLEVFGEYEQDVVEASQTLIAGGANYQLNTKTRLYARHEFVSTLGSPFELNTSQRNNRTVLGLETEYMRDASVYSEYRVRNAIDGGQAEASTGLRNAWDVARGVRLNTTFERITPISAGTIGTNDESTAATVGADYTRPEDWKATGRLEGRWGETADNYLNTFGFARKLTNEWTFLARTIVAAQINDEDSGAGGGTGGGSLSNPDLWQGRILAGLAWRQSPEDVWNGLFRYEYKYEEGASYLASPELERQVHVLAASLNYQPARKWIFSGHYAVKYVEENFGASDTDRYFAHLVAGRAIWEFHRRWDAGLNVATTFSESFSNNQWAVGPEIGFIFTKNARIGLGYNVVGFSDRDFDTATTSRGLFLSLRLKFDENLIKWARFSRETDSVEEEQP